MHSEFPNTVRATLVGMPPTREPHPIADETAALRAELSAARATIASLERQLALKIDSVSFTVARVPPPGCAPEDFDEPTVRRRPAVVRREPITKVIDVPRVEVRP